MPASPRTWAWARTERSTGLRMALPHPLRTRAACASLICLWALATHAEDAPPAAAVTRTPSWLVADLAVAARAEGALTVYSSMNEQEGLPLWKMFEDETGVKVNYVRSSDSVILSRVAIENRARQRSWDLAVTTTVNRLPGDALLQFDPPQAPALMAQARDPHRRWYGGLREFQHARLQHWPSQDIAAAQELRGVPRPQGMGGQDRARRHR